MLGKINKKTIIFISLSDFIICTVVHNHFVQCGPYYVIFSKQFLESELGIRLMFFFFLFVPFVIHVYFVLI